jgi:hypothetical protein
MPKALAQLTNLRHLSLGERLVGRWLAVIGQMQQLTYLEFWELEADLDELQHLPVSLVELSLPSCVCHAPERCSASDADNDDGAQAAAEEGGGVAAAAAADHHDLDSGNAGLIDLSYLTRLTNLLLGLDLYSIQREQQPLRVKGLLQLLSLDISRHDGRCTVLPMINLSALQQLRCCVLAECVESEASLLALNSLSALTSVTLGYQTRHSQLDNGSVWAQLSQLRGLRLTSNHGGHQADWGVGFRRVMRDAGAASSLRQLRMNFIGITAHCMRPKLFVYLTGLQQLQDLQLIARDEYNDQDDDPSDADDAMHLTALTGLTSLDVCGWWVGDVTAVALIIMLPIKP